MKHKRLLCIFLILSMVLSYASVAFAAAPAAEIVLEAPSVAPKKDEEFTVTISINNNPGICSMDLCIGYNTDEMECTKAAAGDVTKRMANASNPKANLGAKISAASATPIKHDGVIGTLTFKALKDVTSYNFELIQADLHTEQIEKIQITAVNFGDNALSGNTEEQSSYEPSESMDQVEETVVETNTVYTFTDTKGTWCEEYVSNAVKNKIFSGYSDGTFRPKNNITRAQFVTILYRMAGSPECNTSTGFTDIGNINTEFQKAIAWAKSKGYIDGTTATTFNPNGYLTREQAVKILFQYSGGQSGMEIMFTSIYDGNYTDMSSVSSWAKKGMYWSIYNKVIEGTSATTLNPKGKITRGAAAKILTTYMNLNK